MSCLGSMHGTVWRKAGENTKEHERTVIMTQGVVEIRVCADLCNIQCSSASVLGREVATPGE